MSTGNQVEKPRFFIDLLNYQYHIGNVAIAHTHHSDGDISQNVISLNPHNMFDATHDSDNSYFKVAFKHPISVPPGATMFVAVLGHDFATKDVRGRVLTHAGGAWAGDASNDGTISASSETCTSLVNGGAGGTNWSPLFDGWSLLTFSPGTTESISSFHLVTQNQTSSGASDGRYGCFALGFVYEPEFHADLKLNQSVLMDGVKNKQTKGGHTYSVMNYTKPPNWWTGSAWELTDPNSVIPPVAFSNSRIGRRTWDISFSQLSDRFYTSGVPNGVFPANNMVNRNLVDVTNGNYSSGEDYDSENGMFNYDINNDRSLYSTVYHHTLGGTLPFLFSPSQDNSPQNFAICRFDKPGFKVQQKSYKKFNIKMKINESW